MGPFGVCPECRKRNLIPDPMPGGAIYVRCENDVSCGYRRKLSQSEKEKYEKKMSKLGLNDSESQK